jgi:hypothetical protein
MTQIDFLDDLGRQLDGAAGRLIREQRRSRFRGLLAPAAALAAVAAIAVAVWPSGPADLEREVAAPAAPESAEEILAVLRRPESEADRSAPAREGREALAHELPAGPAFRLLDTTEDGKGIVLGAAGTKVCLYYPDADGGGIGCWTAADIAKGHSYGSLGKHLHGVAPDGVVAVWIDTLDDSRRILVRDNFFRFDEASLPQVVAIAFEDADRKRSMFHSPEAARVPVVAVPDETIRKADELAQAEPLPRPDEPLRDLLAAVAEATSTVPQPPGLPEDYDWTAKRGDMAEIATVADVRGLIEFRAQCAWQRYWLAAMEAGADGVAAQAEHVIMTVSRWPALRGSRENFDRMALSVANGIAAGVAREVARNCGDVPPLPPEPPRPGP